jgi:hypothetical protein
MVARGDGRGRQRERAEVMRVGRPLPPSKGRHGCLMAPRRLRAPPHQAAAARNRFRARGVPATATAIARSGRSSHAPVQGPWASRSRPGTAPRAGPPARSFPGAEPGASPSRATPALQRSSRAPAAHSSFRDASERRQVSGQDGCSGRAATVSPARDLAFASMGKQASARSRAGLPVFVRSGKGLGASRDAGISRRAKARLTVRSGGRRPPGFVV